MVIATHGHGVIHFCRESFTYPWNSDPAPARRTTAAAIAQVIAPTMGSRKGTMYRAVTRNIEVVVTPRFVADRSSPENNYFFWAYTISITNNGTDTVQLKTRHWRITDANGRRQEVRGAGVVGEEPVLKAGESFEYTSGVPLQTPSGFMAGSYGMVGGSGEHFDIDVPAFSLDSVETKRTIN
jgi:ApaG protein